MALVLVNLRLAVVDVAHKGQLCHGFWVEGLVVVVLVGSRPLEIRERAELLLLAEEILRCQRLRDYDGEGHGLYDEVYSGDLHNSNGACQAVRGHSLSHGIVWLPKNLCGRIRGGWGLALV